MPRDIATINLWDTATAVATTGVITSEAFNQYRSLGFCTLLVILTGTGPSVDITFQVAPAKDGTYYSPVDGNGTGLGTIYTTLTATAAIQFFPVVAPHMKIIITGDGDNGADTYARAYLYFAEDL